MAKPFSAIIADARQKLGLSQADMAQRLQVSQSTVAALEGGRRQPGVRVIRRLAEVLHVPLDSLMAGKPATGGRSPGQAKLFLLAEDMDETDLDILIAVAEVLRRKKRRD